MQSYDRFVGIVARARRLDEQELRNGVADGRILSGTDAFAAKLVNQLGYIEDAYAKARELGGAPNAEVVRYKRIATFSSLLKMFGSAKAPEIKVDMLQGIAETSNPAGCICCHRFSRRRPPSSWISFFFGLLSLGSVWYFYRLAGSGEKWHPHRLFVLSGRGCDLRIASGIVVPARHLRLPRANGGSGH